jgi:hypothetical protein
MPDRPTHREPPPRRRRRLAGPARLRSEPRTSPAPTSSCRDGAASGRARRGPDPGGRASGQPAADRRRLRQLPPPHRRGSGARARPGQRVAAAQAAGVADDFDRALEAMPAELRGVGWIEGIVLLDRKLRQLLESEGVTPIEAIGRPFDPREHEAIASVPRPGARRRSRGRDPARLPSPRPSPATRAWSRSPAARPHPATPTSYNN